MKVKSFVTALLLMLTTFSCSKYDDSEIWDYVKGMNNRLTALEEKCKDMNTNITSLQTIVAAFENGDYITNVAPVMRNGIQIGYTITFLKSAPITIYNGNDGTDGNDGYTPVMGVKKDADGLYYWTVDGEWLITAEGDKVRASGIDGQDGSNGTDGTNGDNGITPLLKIENEYWYVSYDEGTSWQMLGKATGDKGTDGASLFSSVEVVANEVIFILSDGTSFSIPLKNSTVEDVHKAVDLGLPSGTLWATCNVGADSPEEYGFYFAWGETQPKDEYSWTNYLWAGGQIPIGGGTYTASVTKYCFNYGYINGFTDNKAELEPVNDAATVYWGEDWQMPSKEQCEELVNNSYTETDLRAYNKVLCLRVTSKINGNIIILPASGQRQASSLLTEYNMYWSRSLNTDDSRSACIMEFSSGSDYFVYTNMTRSVGLPVRPVRKQ